MMQWYVACERLAGTNSHRPEPDMAKLVHTLSTHVRSAKGEEYVARIYGREERPGGTWLGWLEFHPVTSGGRVLRTGTETSQPDYEALDYWAGGLEPVYLEGALERARPATAGS
jgi:hypothetical protein